MGQQQLLLVILGIIVVGIAIAIGIGLVGMQATSSNKDAIIDDLNALAGQAYQFRFRLRSMGGGQGDYSTFTIPIKLRTSEDATYSMSPSQNSIVFTAVSAQDPSNSITVTLGSDGKLGGWSYYGDFQ